MRYSKVKRTKLSLYLHMFHESKILLKGTLIIQHRSPTTRTQNGKAGTWDRCAN